MKVYKVWLSVTHKTAINVLAWTPESAAKYASALEASSGLADANWAEGELHARVEGVAEDCPIHPFFPSVGLTPDEYCAHDKVDRADAVQNWLAVLGVPNCETPEVYGPVMDAIEESVFNLNGGVAVYNFNADDDENPEA